MNKLILMMLLVVSSFTQAADSLINEGDLLRISVYGNPDLATEVKVSSAGEINFPLIGGVRVTGLSASDTEQLIAKRLIEDGFLKQAQVNIIVLQSTGQQVSVLGQVAKPGKYSIETGAKTLFDFIALSGGVSANGSNIITVIRMNENPPKRISVNVGKLLLTSKAEQINSANMIMQADDIVYVPEAPVYYVYGEASRPGVFPYKQGMIVAQAISVSGGISPRGTEHGLKIKRKDKEGMLQELEADISTAIYADDVIYIKESLF